jgi:hypothetical protein
MDVDRWIESNRARLCELFEDPRIRAEVVELMIGDDQAAKRMRRQRELARDLAEMELRWTRKESQAESNEPPGAIHP